MNSQERPYLELSSFLPENIDEIVSKCLMPSGFSGSETDKYFVAGYPHLLVRHNRGGYPIARLNEAARVFNDLPAHGINSIPYIPVESDGEPYVITYRVSGRNLEDIIEEGADAELESQMDTLWSNLSTYLMTCKQQDLPCAREIYKPDQYMVGTVVDEHDPNIWLVDLGQSTSRLDQNPTYPEYDEIVLGMVNTFIHLESRVTQHMTRCRRSLELTIQTLETPRFIGFALEALRTNTPMDLPDDIIYFE